MVSNHLHVDFQSTALPFELHHQLVEERGVEPRIMACKAIVIPFNYSPVEPTTGFEPVLSSLPRMCFHLVNYAGMVLRARVELAQYSLLHCCTPIMLPEHLVRLTGFEPARLRFVVLMESNLHSRIWYTHLDSNQDFSLIGRASFQLNDKCMAATPRFELG